MAHVPEHTEICPSPTGREQGPGGLSSSQNRRDLSNSRTSGRIRDLQDKYSAIGAANYHISHLGPRDWYPTPLEHRGAESERNTNTLNALFCEPPGLCGRRTCGLIDRNGNGTSMLECGSPFEPVVIYCLEYSWRSDELILVYASYLCIVETTRRCCPEFWQHIAP
jgi:hypothetical protein